MPSPIAAEATRRYSDVVLSRWIATLSGIMFAADVALLGSILAWHGVLPGAIPAWAFAAFVLVATLAYVSARKRRPFQRLTSDRARLQAGRYYGGSNDGVPGARASDARPVGFGGRVAMGVLLPAFLIPVEVLLHGVSAVTHDARLWLLMTAGFALFLLPLWVPWIVGAVFQQRIVAHHLRANPDEVAAITQASVGAFTPEDALRRLLTWESPR